MTETFLVELSTQTPDEQRLKRFLHQKLRNFEDIKRSPVKMI